MERKKIKKWYFSIKVWSFDQAYKKCPNRDFSIFDLIFENLPINLDGAMIPQKKWQTFLYQNIPQPAQLAHPRVSNNPRKVYPMWRDSDTLAISPCHYEYQEGLEIPYKLTSENDQIGIVGIVGIGTLVTVSHSKIFIFPLFHISNAITDYCVTLVTVEGYL